MSIELIFLCKVWLHHENIEYTKMITAKSVLRSNFNIFIKSFFSNTDSD